MPVTVSVGNVGAPAHLLIDSAALAPGRFFGAVLGQQRRDGFVLSELRHFAASRPPRHTHQLAYVSVLLHGSYCERYASRAIEYGPGTAVFHPAGTTHVDEIGRAGGHFLILEIDEGWLAATAVSARDYSAPIVRLGGRPQWIAARLLHLMRSHAVAHELDVVATATEMLAALASEEEPRWEARPPWLALVYERLRGEFRDPPSLRSLAITARVHPGHLVKAFRRVYGRSIGAQVQRWRVEWVSERLRDGDDPLACIALDAGFADQSHCTRVFRRATGLTPGLYRRLLRVPRGQGRGAPERP